MWNLTKGWKVPFNGRLNMFLDLVWVFLSPSQGVGATVSEHNHENRLGKSGWTKHSEAFK